MKSFDQYMAESGQQSTLDNLRKTFQYDSARSQYEKSGSFGQSQQSFGGNAGNFEDTVRRAQALQQEAYKPIINQLQSNIPGVQKTFETQRQTLEAKRKPLQDRYQALLSDLNNRQTQDVNRQTLATNNELGKRGILGSSGAAAQEIINTTNPINQAYSAQTKDVGLAAEEAQMALTEQQTGLSTAEVEAIRNIQNAIAQYQAQGNTEGLNLGSNQFNFMQQQEAAARAAQQQQAQFDAQQALALRQLNEVTLPQSRASIADTNSQIAQRNKANTGMTAADFLKSLQGGAPVKKTASVLDNTKPGLSSFYN